MEPFIIKKGMDIPLAGAPRPAVAESLSCDRITVYPNEIEGLKPRPVVKPGEAVRRGAVLFFSKKNPDLKFRSPATGVVEDVVLGQRRMLEQVVLRVAAKDDPEPLPRFTSEQLLRESRERLLGHLQDAGYLALIRQRPFSRMANPQARPKSIFVNAMNTAPFQPDAAVAVRGHESAFQAGLNALTRLTAGKVHLCLPHGRADLPQALTGANHVTIHYFKGPHPSGNTSVHIHLVDPIRPHDVVWTVRAVDVVQLGRLLTDGAVPSDRVISLGGPGVKEEERRHYRVRLGMPLAALLAGKLLPGEQRLVAGDALSGAVRLPGESLRFLDAGLTVLPEGRERHFLGWIAPGWNLFSGSRTFLSTWLRPRTSRALTTSRRGSPRAMVLTGLYDRFMPMNILVDYLVRAVLARDVEEAVRLGLLETDPEDFALCAFACPSKMELVEIMRKGLAEVEREGI